MSRCPSCGGVIGLDCFNPVECAHITDNFYSQSKEEYAAQQCAEKDRQLTEALKEVERLKTSSISEIYIVYDTQDGEALCAFSSEQMCRKEAEECGCGMRSLRLVHK